MAPLKPVPNVARLVFNGSFLGTPIINTMHVRRPSGGWPVDACVSMAQTARAAYVARFIPLVDADYVLGEVSCTDLTSDIGAFGSQSGTSPGLKTGASLPPNVSICISWFIDRHYRGGRPRMYMCGMGTADVDTSNSRLISTTAHTAWNTAADGFFDDLDDLAIVGENVAMVAVHRVRNKAILDVPLVSNIRGAHVDRRFDSQRRRLGPDVAV